MSSQSKTILLIATAIVIAMAGWVFYQVSDTPSTQRQQTETSKEIIQIASKSDTGQFLLGGDPKRALYVYEGDKLRNGKFVTGCLTQCTEEWTPYTANSELSTSTRADDPLLNMVGTVERPGGELQYTFQGKPLYLFPGDETMQDTEGLQRGEMWSLAPSPFSQPAQPTPAPSP